MYTYMRMQPIHNAIILLTWMKVIIEFILLKLNEEFAIYLPYYCIIRYIFIPKHEINNALPPLENHILRYHFEESQRSYLK